MTATGVIVPRVVVRPPNVPAPPPISLLTQGNLVEGLPDAMQPEGNPNRWEGGGGTAWWEPLRQTQATTWQSWPDAGGSAASSKLDAPGGAVSVLEGPDSSYRSAVQRPIIAALEITESALADYVLEHAAGEVPIEAQMSRALDAVMPRFVERELWAAAESSRAAWTDQCRLKSSGFVGTSPALGPVPVLRALALAEQVAADFGFIDNYGGAMIHCSFALFSLMVGISHGLVRSPTGRQVMTMSGCLLVPEPGATGTWSESGDDLAAVPAGSPVGDNIGSGWLFVTPPVRVRLGEVSVREAYRSTFESTNDYTLVGERAFTIEFATKADDGLSVGIPVDYTKET